MKTRLSRHGGGGEPTARFRQPGQGIGSQPGANGPAGYGAGGGWSPAMAQNLYKQYEGATDPIQKNNFIRQMQLNDNGAGFNAAMKAGGNSLVGPAGNQRYVPNPMRDAAAGGSITDAIQQMRQAQGLPATRGGGQFNNLPGANGVGARGINNLADQLGSRFQGTISLPDPSRNGGVVGPRRPGGMFTNMGPDNMGGQQISRVSQTMSAPQGQSKPGGSPYFQGGRQAAPAFDSSRYMNGK